MKENNFTNHNLVRAPIDLSEYLFKNNNDGTAVHCPQSVSLERAKEVSEVFKAYDGEASDKAYNNVAARLETRSKYLILRIRSLSFLTKLFGWTLLNLIC